MGACMLRVEAEIIDDTTPFCVAVVRSRSVRCGASDYDATFQSPRCREDTAYLNTPTPHKGAGGHATPTTINTIDLWSDSRRERWRNT